MRRGSMARLVVRCASLMVPKDAREEWTSEWLGELWHVCRDCVRTNSPGRTKESLTFSLGAVQDACWIRLDALRERAAGKFRAGSALRCEMLLGALAAAGILLCVVLPGARATLQPLPYRDAHELVLISSNSHPGTQAPSIRLSDYREWTTDTAGLYKQMAFYQSGVQRIHLTHHRTATLSVAVASGNLLQMLGVPEAANGMGDGPRLYLSRSAWKKYYRGRADVFGRMADVAGQAVEIAGVVPNADWRLPGSAEAWLLEDAPGLARLPSTATGFVIARIRDSAFPPPHAGWRSMVETRNGVVLRYFCSSLDAIGMQPLFAFGCSLLLAILALPAITALSLGDYPLSREPMRRRLVARRWLFLASKFLLVIAVVFFWSTSLAFGPGFDLSNASGIQALASFLPLLFGFRWVLQDQRRRCPVCLRLLSNPARVGQPSCNFLGWAGTELMCASGHGLLHIPELPTSWFGTQRWLCLDSSWLCLFAERPSTPADVV
jgi:hypothetical protein